MKVIGDFRVQPTKGCHVTGLSLRQSILFYYPLKSAASTALSFASAICEEMILSNWSHIQSRIAFFSRSFRALQGGGGIPGIHVLGM